jgi:hypothetical protein
MELPNIRQEIQMMAQNLSTSIRELESSVQAVLEKGNSTSTQGATDNPTALALQENDPPNDSHTAPAETPPTPRTNRFPMVDDFSPCDRASSYSSGNRSPPAGVHFALGSRPDNSRGASAPPIMGGGHRVTMPQRQRTFGPTASGGPVRYSEPCL